MSFLLNSFKSALHTTLSFFIAIISQWIIKHPILFLAARVICQSSSFEWFCNQLLTRTWTESTTVTVIHHGCIRTRLGSVSSQAVCLRHPLTRHTATMAFCHCSLTSVSSAQSAFPTTAKRLRCWEEFLSCHKIKYCNSLPSSSWQNK